MSDFGKRDGENFAGWLPRDLLSLEGEPLLFQGGEQTQGSTGLTLFPAVADGGTAAFVVTDIWQDHPEPWVQPVWTPRDESGAVVDGVANVFPVDIDSTFYSPFWRAEFLLTPGLTDTTFRSAREVLAGKYERRTGGIILCPIVPKNTGLADDGTGPRDPVTQRPLTSPPPATAFVDKKEVQYLPLGSDRVQAQGQNLTATNAYFFVESLAGDERDKLPQPLPLSVVLPNDALRNSLVNRVDVALTEEWAVFVPSNRPALRAMLEARGLTVQTVPAALDAFPEFALRVARVKTVSSDAGPPVKETCFTEAAFATCEWLDTPEKLEALPAAQRIARPVQLAIAVVIK